MTLFTGRKNSEGNVVLITHIKQVNWRIAFKHENNYLSRYIC